MRAAAIALAVALAAGAACWSERAPQRPQLSSTPVPGTLWVTPAQPWRVRLPPRTLAVAGGTAMLSDGGGWIARFDLARGVVVRERDLAGFAIDQLLALPGGRWLLVGVQGRRAVAATIDPATLEPTVVVTAREDARPPAGRSMSGAVVLDEGIAIAAEGLPLAIYDLATWDVRRVVDPAIGWARAGGGGRTLYAVAVGEGRGGFLRFDLATGASEEPTSSLHAQATARYLATWEHDRGKRSLTVEGRGRKVRISQDEVGAVLDDARDRIAVRERTKVHVHALPGGERVASYDLGESGHSEGYPLAFDGDRLVVVVSAMVRVIDLRTGAITPAGAPPYTAGRLAVNDGGEVQCLGTHALRVVGGEIRASALVGSAAVAAGDPHQVARYGVFRSSGAGKVSVLSLGSRTPARAWRFEGPVDDVWLGRDGAAVIQMSGGGEHRLLRGTADELEELVPIRSEAWVQDVDVDSGYASVSILYTAYLLRLGARLGDATIAHHRPNPGCASTASGKLERRGDRWIVHDGPEVALYRRSTGALVGTASIEEAGRGVIRFVPGRDEILFVGTGALALWDPAAGTLRRLGGIAGLAEAQVSPDARRVALSFFDGRLALAELDALRAAMTPGPAPSRSDEADQPCGEVDPRDADVFIEP